MRWPAKACGRRGIATRREAHVLVGYSAPWHAMRATIAADRLQTRARLRSGGSLGPARIVPVIGWRDA